MQSLRFELLWLKAYKEYSMPHGLYYTNSEYEDRISQRNGHLSFLSSEELKVPNHIEFIENEFLIDSLGKVVISELDSFFENSNNTSVDEKSLPIPLERIKQFSQIDINKFVSYRQHAIRKLQSEYEIFVK